MRSEALDEASLRQLLAASRGLVAELDFETVLDRVLSTAQELTGARYAALGILDARRAELDRFLTKGVSAATHAAIGDLPRGRGILGVLIADPHPLRLDDVGAHAQSYGFPAGHPPMRTFLGAPILVRGETWGNLYLTEKDDGPFTAADEAAAVLLADWAAVAIDNARMYEREATRRSELEHMVRAFEASHAIARALGGETDLARVLELIAKRGRALVEAREMLILLREDARLVVAAAAGEISGTAIGRSIPLDRSTSGRVLASGRPMRVADVERQLQFSADELGVPAARTALLVPLTYRGRGVGVLIAFDRLVGGPEFGADDERIVLGFAASAATAVATAQSIERVRLRDSLQSAERERQRWARELHDATLQGLAALRLTLSAARDRDDPDVLDRAVAEAIEQLVDEMATLRALITDLRPPALDDVGVSAALQALTARATALHNLDIELELDFAHESGRAPERLTSDIETTIYRTIQEGLTNVTKHARAASARVTIAEHGGTITVTIADDGRGFDAAAHNTGFGLVGMRERAALVRGSLDFASSPAGTTITLTLPTVHRVGGAPREAAAS